MTCVSSIPLRKSDTWESNAVVLNGSTSGHTGHTGLVSVFDATVCAVRYEPGVHTNAAEPSQTLDEGQTTVEEQLPRGTLLRTEKENASSD